VSDRPQPNDLSLPDIAHSLARYRGSSFVLMELTTEGDGIFAEDCTALQDRGIDRCALALAVVLGLRDMLARAERDLAEQEAQALRHSRGGKPD
jgi:hypothetical protein